MVIPAYRVVMFRVTRVSRCNACVIPADVVTRDDSIIIATDDIVIFCDPRVSRCDERLSQRMAVVTTESALDYRTTTVVIRRRSDR